MQLNLDNSSRTEINGTYGAQGYGAQTNFSLYLSALDVCHAIQIHVYLTLPQGPLATDFPKIAKCSGWAFLAIFKRTFKSF